MRWCQWTCEWTGLNRGFAWQNHTMMGLIRLLQSYSCVPKHRFAPIKHDVILGRKSSIRPLSTHTCVMKWRIDSSTMELVDSRWTIVHHTRIGQRRRLLLVGDIYRMRWYL
jgi:hypothetical protein